MSFSDDALMAKLSALNETQEGIVTVSQWVIFHKYVEFRLDLDVCLWFLLTNALSESQTICRADCAALATKASRFTSREATQFDILGKW